MATPATLMLHLTGQCNLECRHCYMDGSPRRREQLPFDWIVESLRAAPGLGIGTLFLTGGEPLLYARFREVADVAAAVPGLTTKVHEAEAELFARLRFDVHVSIDGMAPYHDAFRAMAGAFRRAERGVGLMVAAGVPVTIVATISADNLQQFEDIARWARDAGATRLLVQPLLDLGRGAMMQDQKLSSRQLNELILRTSDIASESQGSMTASIIGGSKRFLLAHPCAAYVCNGGGCHRGVTAEIKKVVVREDGFILPEATNLDHQYAIGHVHDGALGPLIARYFGEGFSAFDRLCRTTYDEFVPDWPDAIVPWDQLIALRSRTALPDRTGGLPERGCGGKTTAPIWLSPAVNARPAAQSR